MIGWVLTGTLVFVLACPPAAHAQPSPSSSTSSAVFQLEALTARFGEDARRPRTSPADDDALEALAGQRRVLLARLMDEAPADILRLAYPAGERDGLPPAARALTEEHVDLSGTIEVSYEDHRGFSRLRHVLDTGTTRYSLHFSSDPPGWTTGQRIRVRGVRVNDALALDGNATTTSASPLQALAGTAGEQRTLVILVSFRDTPAPPYPTTHAADVVFSQTDGFFRENSGGAAWITGDVYGWFTIDMPSTICDTTTLATLAKAAAQGAGATLSNYQRYVYAFPRNACTWWGLGSVGGNPSQAWINGDMALDVAGHELGHNLGLYHSRNMDCGSTTIGTGCTVNEYGDTLDLMGATRGHYNAFQKERLGWLAPSQIVTLTDTTNSTYVIEPYASPTGGVKALKILKSTDPTTGLRTFYYVEQRQAIGYDAFMSGWANVMSGVAVHTGSESGGNTTYLLDMTPETSSWYDPALIGGRTFADATAGLALETVSAGASGATVSIALAPPATACVRATPQVTLSGSSGSVSAGTPVSYTVTVANSDSAACPSSTFALAPAVPAGWSGVLDVASLSMAPGTNRSTTLRVTSSGSTASGTYQVAVGVSDAAVSTHAASAAATYTVASAAATPSLQVSTDRASYLRSDTVAMTARVLSGSAPLSGASVTFQIRKADGKTTTATATSDAMGQAIYRLRLRAKDPVGTWQVSASTAGASSGTATFTVAK